MTTTQLNIKEHPILFSREMVQAILNDRKTQTRRVVKPTQSFPRSAPLEMEPWIVDGDQQEDDSGLPCWIGKHPNYPTGDKWFSCPYGKPGDRLWVRETWAPGMVFKGDVQEYLYRATHAQSRPAVWRPSIFMPRAASRITLEIIGVRVERVQDISLEDCVAEGCPGDDPEQASPDKSRAWRNAHAEYATLWDSINAKRGYGWDTNPWVWVLTFEVLYPRTGAHDHA